MEQMDMFEPDEEQKAVVVLSGGQDSTTCLFWALRKNFYVKAVTFDYGQRHNRELESARKVAAIAGVPHEVITIGDNILQGSSPLVSNNELEQYAHHSVLPGGLEKTFVPMRNQLFLTIAGNRAYNMGSNKIVTGVAEEDFGGYPDCRSDFIRSFEATSSYGTFTGKDGAPSSLTVMTPLMAYSKADTVLLAQSLGWSAYMALAYTHTSYDGAYPPTGNDHATLLRQKGFEQANMPDPLVVRAYTDGLMELPNSDNYSTQVELVRRISKSIPAYNSRIKEGTE